MNDDASMLAALAILATAVGGLIWVIKYLFTKMLPAIEDLTKMTKANTAATKSADTYLRERNGRDIEKHTELVKATEAIPVKMQQIADAQAKALLGSVRQIREQHVEHQSIEHSTVSREGSANGTNDDKQN